MKSQLAMAMILVRDTMPQTKRFYVELLGFEVVPEFSAPDDSFIYLRSEKGGAEIALQDASRETYGGTTGRGGVILGFQVADADEVYKNWQAEGVEFATEVTDVGVGRSFTAKDPAGNYVQVYHMYEYGE